MDTRESSLSKQAANRAAIVAELFRYLLRGRWWLIPIVAILLLVGAYQSFLGGVAAKLFGERRPPRVPDPRDLPDPRRDVRGSGAETEAVANGTRIRALACKARKHWSV